MKIIKFEGNIGYYIDKNNFEPLKNDAFKNALFLESLKRETVDNYCYLYLLITSNFFSKYNFVTYENPKTLEGLLEEYLNFKLQNPLNNPVTISNLDRILLLELDTKLCPSFYICHYNKMINQWCKYISK